VVEIANRRLKGILSGLMEQKGRGIYAEFDQLKAAPINASTKEATSHRAQSRNRYTNIVPFDYNRVKLGANGSGPYVNASLVESASGEYPDWAFIATQGPMRETVDDFWQMVYEYNCHAIVMLTRFVERNTEKCAVYFPRHVGQVLNTNQFQISLLECKDVSMDITVRRIELQHRTSHEVMQVSHYHYHEWPDHGVPQFTRPTRDLINMLEKSEAKKSRVIVHCSAGVGRTGAFCTIHIILRRLKALQDDLALTPDICQRSAVINDKVDCAINIPRLITALRAQRGGMVQNIDQYYFCYQAIIQELDAVLSRK